MEIKIISVDPDELGISDEEVKKDLKTILKIASGGLEQVRGYLNESTENEEELNSALKLYSKTLKCVFGATILDMHDLNRAFHHLSDFNKDQVTGMLDFMFAYGYLHAKGRVAPVEIPEEEEERGNGDKKEDVPHKEEKTEWDRSKYEKDIPKDLLDLTDWKESEGRRLANRQIGEHLETFAWMIAGIRDENPLMSLGMGNSETVKRMIARLEAIYLLGFKDGLDYKKGEPEENKETEGGDNADVSS